MSERRLIDLWEAPSGVRLVSAIATSYELDADFLEEDLLPAALGLRLPPGRGREFRLELEHALQDTEVSIFFDPERYRPGLRRSPRIDLIALPEGRFPKLHAKVALLRFVDAENPEPRHQIVRLVVGSANLTTPGYRTNIEVAAALDDAPDAAVEAVTAVRDALDWLETLVADETGQVAHQIRDLRAVFASRSLTRSDQRLRFVGLPAKGGFPPLLPSGESLRELTIASPFWPSGEDLDDVVGALAKRTNVRMPSVRLIGPAHVDEAGQVQPIIPAALLHAFIKQGARVQVAVANPNHGCTPTDDQDEGELDQVAERHAEAPQGQRELHAKALLAVGVRTTALAIGSFNLTRKGLGLVGSGNAEAGLLWMLPAKQATALRQTLSFATAWQQVDGTPKAFVIEPGPYDTDEVAPWPTFIRSLYARRDALYLEGDAASWPARVDIRMQDIRARLYQQEQEFDPWVVRAPTGTAAVFKASTPLVASWLSSAAVPVDAVPWTALPDLEATVVWDGHKAVVPVRFEDKHLFPVVESPVREDEQALIAWFLGLRPPGEVDEPGFGHAINPLPRRKQVESETNDILSYRMREFVHALPGVRARLAEAGLTETGLRTALSGPRSAPALAEECVRAYREQTPGGPQKTAVATLFQLRELQQLLQTAALPRLPDGVTERLRAEAITRVSSTLEQMRTAVAPDDLTPALRAYLDAAEVAE